MCGNGVLMTGTVTMKVRQQMVVLGLTTMIIFIISKDMLCCGAVPSSTILDSAVPRPASTSIGRSATASATILVFVLSARLGGFFSSPLYFFPLALYSISFFLLCRLMATRIF